MPDDFCRSVNMAHASKVSGVPRERAIRLYCVHSGSGWALQVRAPMSLKSGRPGKDFIVAHAVLDVDDLRALRDACAAQLIQCLEDEVRYLKSQGE